MKQRRFWQQLQYAVGTALLTLGMQAGAADFPSRQVQWIVPFPAGGATDLVARAIAPDVGSRLKQPVIVDNRPGANTLIGAQAIARAEPDGHTIGLMTNSMTVQPVLNKAWDLDAVKHFAPVSQLATIPLFVTINPKVLPLSSLEQLIFYAKANPGKLNYATSGGADILTIELFRRNAGIDIVIVPYKGEAPALAAMLSGEAHIFTGNVNNVTAHQNAGTLRPLAVTDKRTDKFPNVPAAKDAGAPGFEFSVWFGVVGPAATPRPAINRLNAALLEALRAPATKSSYIGTCCSIIGNSPEAFAKVIQDEAVRFKKVAAEANMQLQ